MPPVYPPGARGTARVVLQVDIDEHGNPGSLVVLGDPPPGSDEAALAAAGHLRFEPARRGERPVPVRIQYAFNFVPPPPAEPPRPQDRPVNLTGRIRERGTRRKLSGIEVTAGDGSAVTDPEGRFEIRGLPEGEPIEDVHAHGTSEARGRAGTAAHGCARARGRLRAATRNRADATALVVDTIASSE